MSPENDAPKNAAFEPEIRSVRFARAPGAGVTVGVVTRSEEPSTLALLAAGVAGMAARQARRERMKAK